MAVPKHIVQFAEASMEQAALITFAKKLNLTGTKFLDASRDTGVKFAYKIPQSLCFKINCETTEPPILPVSSALAVFDELSSYAFVTQDRTRRFGVSVYLSTEILQLIPAGTDVIITAKAKKIGKTLGFATMEMHNLEGSLLARGDHIKHLPMGFMWDFLAHFMQSRFVLPIILKYGESLNKMKNYFFSDSQIVKFLIGGGIQKNEIVVDEKSDNDKIGSVFDDLGLIRRNNSSQQNDKKYNRINLSGENSEIKNTDSQNFEVEVFSLKVRPALMNFLGRLHGGALAMSIEEAIRTRSRSRTITVSPPYTDTHTPTRTHHEASKIIDHDIVENDSDKKDEGNVIGMKEVNRSKIGRNMNHLNKISDPQESTIVRMEVTYKSSMTSELDITCKDDVHSAGTYNPEQNTSINSNTKFRVHSRRTVGEVFNHRDKNNRDKSKDSKINSGGDTYIGPSATYTCYWSGTS